MEDLKEVLAGRSRFAVMQADCLAWMEQLPEQSVDLVFGSPPYMDARTYGIGAQRDCQQWVDWMLLVTEAAIRVTKGLVLWVVGGVQRKGCYWPGCEGLTWEWSRRGGQLWRPCVWWKVNEQEGGTGIPGSGGKQWLRADWEYVLAFKRPGELPWADNTAMGHEPIYDRKGGPMSNRTADGARVNDPWGPRWRGSTLNPNGKMQAGSKDGKRRTTVRTPAGHDADGNLQHSDGRPMPKIANPGNVLAHVAGDDSSNMLAALEDGLVVKARVGGGHIGSRLAHEGEAPFPEKLAEFFVRSFCPRDGLVADCFSGTGTTLAVALRLGRRAIGCDVRESQVLLTRRRVAGETPLLF
jgi:hypothetical protein